MNGGIIPGTPIVVDFWKIRECGTGKLFFLTHLHGDHIVGLTSSWNRPIYCSPITAKLLDSRFHVNTAFINILEENESHVINAGDEQYITVTVINANHCPGAVMFLFEGDFGKILYTGDFRFCSKMKKSSPLSDHLGSIDIVYLDNTYCTPACDFLTQDEATQSILTIIRRFPKHNIVFGMRNLGKEQLLVNIALELKEWIAVPGRIMEVASLLDMPNVFVLQDDAPDCRLRVAPFQTVSVKQLSLWNDEKPTIGILPSALYTGMGEMRPTYFKSTHRFIVPYSDHSSYSELLQFIACIRPKKVIPIVKANAKGPCGLNLAERANMSCFDHLLRSSPIRPNKRRTLNDPTSARVELFPTTTGDDPMDKNSRRILKRRSRGKVAKGVNFTDSPRKSQEKNITYEPIVGKQQTKSVTYSTDDSSVRKNGCEILSDKDAMLEIYEIRNDEPPSKILADISVKEVMSSAVPVSDKTDDSINCDKLTHPADRPHIKKSELDKEDKIDKGCNIENIRSQDKDSMSSDPKSNNTIVPEPDAFINRSPGKITEEHLACPQDVDIVLSGNVDSNHVNDQASCAKFPETGFLSVKKIVPASEERRSLYNSLERWFHIGCDVDDVFG